MEYKFGKIIVVALGGSVVYPETIDIDYLTKFRKFAQKIAKRGIKLVLVVGGGRLARVFQDAAHKVVPLSDEDKDWIGIHSTRLNAHLLRTIFKKTADPIVIDERGKIKKLEYSITIASGWRPGWSTDFVAAALAKDFKVPEFVVVGRPSFVYHKNPDDHKDAKSYRKISWRNYRKLIPRKWVPGSHAPVDPVSAKLAEESGIKAIIVSGHDLKNFSRLLGGKEFRGTLIG